MVKNYTVFIKCILLILGVNPLLIFRKISYHLGVTLILTIDALSMLA